MNTHNWRELYEALAEDIRERVEARVEEVLHAGTEPESGTEM